ncbi:MAG: rhomboid family intramembrane serine protease [Acidobacteriaceae bacterium]|nr:rhomboid family intramembrane serine protease [Acidobacteriaceae bacterium]
MEKRRMCPNCRAFISITDRICPYCNTQLGPRAIDLRASQLGASLLPRANLTSVIILIINITFFLIELIVNYSVFHSSPENLQLPTLVALGAKFAPYIYRGQYWRLITAGFLHGGFIHIAMNSWALFDLVGEVEQFYGTSRLIVAYIFSTITGFWLSLMWRPGVPSLGASAACFGLIGIMLAMGVRRRTDPLALAVRSFYGRWAIYALIFSFLPGFGIDVAAHIGGLAGGFVIGLMAGLPGMPNSPREVFWKAMAGVAIVITLYAFLQNWLSFQMLMRAMGHT